MEQIPGQYRTMRQMVYASLRKAILGGEFRAGEALSERDLAAKLGVSKTPVREAIRQLEREGLVTAVPYKGVLVTRFSLSEVEEIYEMRLGLEPLAARRAAERITDADIPALRGLVDQMSVEAAKKNHEGLLRANVRFHGKIYELAGNARLRRTLVELQEYVHTARTIEWTVPGGFERNHEHHVAIAEAIIQRRPEEAEARMREHIERSLKLLFAARRSASPGGAQ